MRERRKKRLNIASKPRAARPNPTLKTLFEHVEALEKRVEALEILQDPYAHLREQTAKRGRGKPLRLDEMELQVRRDRLIDWLEAVWPQVGPPLLAAISAEEVNAALKSAPFESDESKQLSARADPLAEFLKSDRWFMPPKARLARALQAWTTPQLETAAKKAAMSLPTRQIACAMAGVPELSWRTSFDRAQRLVSPMAVHAEAEIFYRVKFKLPWPREIWERAERGEPWAQYRVGLSHAHGIGIPEDYTVAAEWYGRAAKLGEPEAQIALAELYRTGKGVPQNPDLAYLWACVVPLTPDRQEWQARLATDVAEEKLPILRNAARELWGLIQKLRFEQSIRPSSSHRTAQEMALLRESEAILKAHGG